MYGSGQSPISPLALRLSQQEINSPWQLAGNLAMVAADTYGRDRSQRDRASTIAELLAGGQTTQQTMGAGGSHPGGGVTTSQPNPEYGRIAELLANNPDLMPAFESAAMQREFPDVFGDQQFGTYYDPAKGGMVYGNLEPGMMASAPESNEWQNAGSGYLYRQGEGGKLEWQRAPGSGGAGLPEAPTTRTVYDDQGREITVEWNGREWQQIGGPKAAMPETPSPSDVVGPLLQKIARGEPLTAGERAALDEYQRTGALDRMMRDAVPGASTAVTPAEPMPEPASGAAAPSPLSQYAEPGETPEQTAARLIQSAKQALAGGADPAAVEAQMRALGLDPALVR